MQVTFRPLAMSDSISGLQALLKALNTTLPGAETTFTAASEALLLAEADHKRILDAQESIKSDKRSAAAAAESLDVASEEHSRLEALHDLTTRAVEVLSRSNLEKALAAAALVQAKTSAIAMFNEIWPRGEFRVDFKDASAQFSTREDPTPRQGLSEGEHKAVGSTFAASIRALVRDYFGIDFQVVAFDEDFANVDKEKVPRTLELVEREAEYRLAFVISHDVEVEKKLKIAQRIRLDDA